MQPWLVHPDLSQDRLELIATTIGAARSGVVAIHNPDAGDSAWSFGCVAHARTMYALAALAATGEHPWLEVDETGLAYRLRVGEVTMRVYRGDSSKPTTKSMKRGLSDLVSLQMRFDFDETLPEETWFWQLTIETHEDGSAARVVLHQVSGRGDTRYFYAIDPSPAVAPIHAVTTEIRAAVELPPVSVTMRHEEQDSGNKSASDTGTGE